MLADRFLGRAEAQSPRGELVDDDIGAARDQRSLGRRILGVRGGYVVGGTVRVEQPAGKTSYSHRFEESGIHIVDVEADRLGAGRSEGSRVGKEGVSTCRSRGSPEY